MRILPQHPVSLMLLLMMVVSALGHGNLAYGFQASPEDDELNQLIAQSKGEKSIELNVDIRPLAKTARTSSPIPVILECQRDLPELLEGDLQLRVTDGFQTISWITVTDLAFTNGIQKLKILLPPFNGENMNDQFDVVMMFTEKKTGKRLKLGVSTLNLGMGKNRIFTTALIADFDRQKDPIPREVRDRIRFDQFDPFRANQNAVLSQYSYTSPSVDPRNLNGDPLELCAFDNLVIHPSTFDLVDSQQLSGISQWIEAGGNVLIFADGLYTPAKTRFLETLLTHRPDMLPLLTTQEGRLEENSPFASSAPLTLNYGLGKVLLFPGGIDQLLEMPKVESVMIAAKLWNVSQEHFQPIEKWGKFERTQIDQNYEKAKGKYDYYGYNYNSAYDGDYSYLPVDHAPISTASQLVGRTLPPEISPMPISVILLILLVYLFLIGPVDYIVLGKLKRRKWTWFTFPLVTLLVTATTLGMAHWYMASDTERRSIIFYDYGEGETIVRSNRFELWFRSFQGTVQTDSNRSLTVPVSHEQFSGNNYNNFQTQSLAGAPQYYGRLPGNYVMTQRLSQWTPSLNRQFKIESEESDLPISLSEIDFDVVTDSGKRLEWANSQSPKLTVVPYEILVVYEGNIWEISRTASKKLIERHTNEYSYGYRDIENGFLLETTTRLKYGLSTLVSKISPSGGPSFEDMALMATNDSDSAVLLVLMDYGQELKVYRKLYRRGESSNSNSDSEDDSQPDDSSSKPDSDETPEENKDETASSKD